MNQYEKSRVLAIVDKWEDEHPNAVNREERLAAVIRMEMNRLDELHERGLEEIAALTLSCGSDNRPRTAEFTIIKDRGSAAVVLDIEVREKDQPTTLVCIRGHDLARLREWLHQSFPAPAGDPPLDLKWTDVESAELVTHKLEGNLFLRCAPPRSKKPTEVRYVCRDIDRSGNVGPWRCVHGNTVENFAGELPACGCFGVK